MGLGTNRDYKTHDRRIRHNLRIHKELMDQLMAEGMDREAASDKAFRDLKDQGKFK